MKPRGGPAAAFSIADVREGSACAKVQRLPGARMRFLHALELDAGGTRGRFSSTIEGPLAWLWGALFGRAFTKNRTRLLEHDVAARPRRRAPT